ncbi:FAD-dependent monooxygenase [Candidatus Pelagibacter sp.]|nr:FAD-dependent monooxygenase [Candidatus Pelagibacter sp.]
MKVCIIGNGLVSLTLANMLVQKNLSVDIVSSRKNNNYNRSRTLAISKSNIDYFNREIVNLNKISWPISKIKIYTEKNFDNEIIQFNNNQQVFSIIKNYHLHKLLIQKLKKKKSVKFKSYKNYQNILNDKYKLIINCSLNHEITKKFFSNRIEKSYNSFAYTTIIDHKKILNNTAYQNFTNNGPIAFLPISKSQTAIVYSLRSVEKKNTHELKKLIKKYNPVYSITKIENCSSFKLKSSNLRKYYKGNILAFGDLLHQIHPLAGQGFNMSIRDIKLLSDLISKKINLGLELDVSICHEFQKNSRDKNYLFSTGIDFIYELFNFESKIDSNFIGKSINLIGKNKTMNSLLKKFADIGIQT